MLRAAPVPYSARWRYGCLAIDGAVQCVDQHLNLDEFVAGPFGLVAVERQGQHFCVRVPVFGHALAGFLQRFKSFAHLASFNGGIGATLQRESQRTPIAATAAI